MGGWLQSLDCFSPSYSHHTLQFNIVQMGLGWVFFLQDVHNFTVVFFQGTENATSEKKPKALNLKAAYLMNKSNL